MPRRLALQPAPLPATPLFSLLRRVIGDQRVQDSRALRVVAREPLLYEVSGGAEPHWVQLTPLSCDCADFLGEEWPCKHIAAVLTALESLPLATQLLGHAGERPARPAAPSRAAEARATPRKMERQAAGSEGGQSD